MSYHIVEISGTDRVDLFCKDGQLFCRKGETTRQVALEDVAAILITAYACTLHSHLLAEAAQHRIPVIVCQCFRPVGIYLPVQRITDTLITRAQIDAPQRLREALWQKTLDAKCGNQRTLMHALAPHRQQSLEQMDVLCAQRTPDKEGPCARLYWQTCSEALGLEAFARDQAEAFGLNSLLNYAYALLLTQTLQALLTSGLDPLYGIGHATRERATPLAYDLMEPFRPLFDAFAFKWLETCRARGASCAVTAPYKRYLREALQAKEAPFLPLEDLLRTAAKGLREAFAAKSLRSYEPWQWRTIKWDGFLSALTSP